MQARLHFNEKVLVDLTLAIVAINGWNRLAISFRKLPGTYHRASHARTWPDLSPRTVPLSAWRSLQL